MNDRERYTEFNAASAFPEKVEGYWRVSGVLTTEPRSSYEAEQAKYPWPVPFQTPPEGYDQDYFLDRLLALEAHEETKVVAYRGSSPHRLDDGKNNGNSEFERDGWHWPAGYRNYIKLGVPPSRAFYQFVTGNDLDTLPTYGRE